MYLVYFPKTFCRDCDPQLLFFSLNNTITVPIDQDYSISTSYTSMFSDDATISNIIDWYFTMRCISTCSSGRARQAATLALNRWRRASAPARSLDRKMDRHAQLDYCNTLWQPRREVKWNASSSLGLRWP